LPVSWHVDEAIRVLYIGLNNLPHGIEIPENKGEKKKKSKTNYI